MHTIVSSILCSTPLMIILGCLFSTQSWVSSTTDFNKSCHISGLILARGGSKGVVLKNLVKLNRRTLLGRALKTMNKFKRFNSVWVSTDDAKIAEEAANNGAKVHWRKNYTATDTASSVVAVKEFLNAHNEINVVFLVQCTSPFLTVEYLSKVMRVFEKGEVDSVFTVTRQFKLRWKETEGGRLEPDNFDLSSRPRRQDWSGELVENGMIYMSRSNLIIKEGLLQGGKVRAVEVPGYDSMEIDSRSDIFLAETLLSLRERNGI